MGKQRIFRKVALDRLSSPERLDELMQATNPRGWIALMAVALVIVTAVLWGIFGNIPDRVHGDGILIKTGGVFAITSLAGGQISDVNVAIGDQIERGQIVARVAQPDILDQITESKALLAELDEQRKRTALFVAKEIEAQKAHKQEQEGRLKQEIEAHKKHLKWLEERIETQEQLHKKGLITKQVLLASKEQYDAILGKIDKANSDLKGLSHDTLKFQRDKERELVAVNTQIEKEKRNIAVARSTLDAMSKVYSSYSGRVLEISVEEGDLVQSGDPILTLELVGKEIRDLVSIVYVKAIDGKKIKRAMDAHISPSTVVKGQYGVMLGKVRFVADFPATRHGMKRVLDNARLIDQLSRDGPPIQVDVDLIPDAKTESGYRWSSGGGPPTKIQSGTLCSGTVVIRRRRPISLLIPFLKEVFLGVGDEKRR